VSESYDVFGIAELDGISFQCPACKTEVTFDLTTPTKFGAPYVCPTCRETYTQLGNFLAAYRDIFNQAAAIQPMNIRLRTKTKV
jgi:hypothetical protein